MKEKAKSEIERAADERREELEHPEKHRRPDPNAGAFNAVEGVPPHGAGIPEKDD
ncbi:MAG: hypothetical protein ABR524_06475 [Thermoanaerobaculia bacterium]